MRFFRAISAAFPAAGGIGLVALIVAMAALGARAQEAPPPDPATILLADMISTEGTSTLVAEGNVEVRYQGIRLRASRIIYTREPGFSAGGMLQIQGPITLTEGDNIVIVAESAQLDADLRTGILRSARMVLDRQLQISAVEIRRTGGRYTQLYKTIASTCLVSAANPTPLWQIRARRIVHDQEARQLYFDGAQLRLMGVPVFYLPRLRLPDPTLKRATGFLVPTVKSTSKLGIGLKVPYFITMGAHADLTLTPYLSPRTHTLEFRLRKAFGTGNVAFSGALSRDDLVAGRTRGYLFGSGRFALPRDFTLSFGLESVTDRAYLLEYGYSQKDRLSSDLSLMRARRDELITASGIYYRTLRSGESNATLPSLIGDMQYQRRFEPGFFGGQADLSFATHGQYRRAATPGVSGRDLERVSARLDWRRSWIWQNGMIASSMARMDADLYTIQQDPAYPAPVSRLTPSLGVELRWPLVAMRARGTRQVLEPVVQLLWTDDAPASLPNEDSTLVELDEGNLFSFSRFPGADRQERGLRANIGLGWTRFDPAGWSMGVHVGRVLFARDLAQFGAGSGLSGRRSDWLAMVRLKTPQNLSLTNRALFDDRLNFTQNETRITWNNQRWTLASSYIWVAAAATSEWTMDGAYKFSDTWTGRTNWRFDFNTGRAAYAGLGMEYRNECVVVDLSLSRRFTSSSSVTPITSFGLTVALTGFGTGAPARASARSCRN